MPFGQGLASGVGRRIRDGDMANRKFRVFLIKPSHYDHEGYVIQWRRSAIPTNSLASVYALLTLYPCASNCRNA